MRSKLLNIAAKSRFQMSINGVFPVVVGVTRPTDKFPTTDVKELSGVLRSSKEAETLPCFAAGDKVVERLGGGLLAELASNGRFTNWSMLIIFNRETSRW